MRKQYESNMDLIEESNYNSPKRETKRKGERKLANLSLLKNRRTTVDTEVISPYHPNQNNSNSPGFLSP